MHMSNIQVFNLRSGVEFWAQHAEREREATELANLERAERIAPKVREIDRQIGHYKEEIRRLTVQKKDLQTPEWRNEKPSDGDE